MIRQKYQRYLTNRIVRGKPTPEQRRENRRRRMRLRIGAWLMLPLIILVRLARPIKLIRFGYVLKHKIGHCPLEAELYLLERLGGVQPRDAFDLFYFDHGTDGLAGNLFAEHLAKRSLRIHPFVECLAMANEMLPGAAPHRIIIETRDKFGFFDHRRLMLQYPQQIDLTAEEEELGIELLAEMGIPKGAEFVCFLVRDSTYWSQRKPGIGADSDYRNASIENAFDAMKAVAERGIYVLRMGAAASSPLPDLHPKIIDYAVKHRNEFMDVFLAGRCKMMATTGSGLDSIPYSFRRPIVTFNLTAFGYSYIHFAQPHLMTFKIFTENGREMPFDEIIAKGAHLFAVTETFQAAHITVVENQPDEVTAVVLEMLDLLDSRLHLDAEDEALRERMRDIFKTIPEYREWQIEMSPHFLRKHRDLLTARSKAPV